MREAIEQVFGLQALQKLAQEKARERDPEEEHGDTNLADTPHLTGDPEWDSLELAETDPMREPRSMVG